MKSMLTVPSLSLTVVGVILAGSIVPPHAQELPNPSRSYTFTAFSDLNGDVANQLLLDLDFQGDFDSGADGAVEGTHAEGDQDPIEVSGTWRRCNDAILVRLDLPAEDGFPSSTMFAWGLLLGTSDGHLAIRGGWSRPRPNSSGFFNAVSSTPAR